MAPITGSVEIDRNPADVFAYMTDPSKATEWQEGLVSLRPESDGPIQQGSRLQMTRRMGKREQAMTSEVTEYDAPRSYAFRVLDGPVRPSGRAQFESLGDGDRTRYSFELDFEGHGIGKLLIPLVVRRSAEKELAQNIANLKRVLEADG